MQKECAGLLQCTRATPKQMCVCHWSAYIICETKMIHTPAHLLAGTVLLPKSMKCKHIFKQLRISHCYLDYPHVNTHIYISGGLGTRLSDSAVVGLSEL